MRSRIFVGVLFGVIVIAAAMVSGKAVTPSQQWTTVDFTVPTIIAGVMVSGPTMIVHDDAKMGRGEACTTVYRFDAAKGPQEKLVSFMCTPITRSVAATFTTKCKPLSTSSGVLVLNEYQFAGDAEAHIVPGVR